MQHNIQDTGVHEPFFHSGAKKVASSLKHFSCPISAQNAAAVDCVSSLWLRIKGFSQLKELNFGGWLCGMFSEVINAGVGDITWHAAWSTVMI